MVLSYSGYPRPGGPKVFQEYLLTLSIDVSNEVQDIQAIPGFIRLTMASQAYKSKMPYAAGHAISNIFTRSHAFPGHSRKLDQFQQLWTTQNSGPCILPKLDHSKRPVNASANSRWADLSYGLSVAAYCALGGWSHILETPGHSRCYLLWPEISWTVLDTVTLNPVDTS